MRAITLFLIVCVWLASACSSSAGDECEKSNVGVRYVITGDHVSIVSLTQSSDTGGMELGDFAVPYCRIMTGFEEGDPLYISAQIEGETGSVTCKIYDEDQLISQSTARTSADVSFAIATCSATK